MNNRITKSALALALSAATLGVAHAAEKSPFSGNVALTSNYVWRGVTQTAEEAAIQGGFDYEHGSGFYLGTWGSNVNFNDDGSTVGANSYERAQMELDLYGGYKFKGGPLDVDVGVLHYAYPGAASGFKYDFTEVYGGVGYGPVSAKLYYTDDYQGNLTKKSATYLDVSADFEVGAGVKLGVHVGKSGGDGIQDAFGKKYTDYKLSVAKEFGGFEFSLAYTDTNMSGAQQIKKGPSANDGMVFLTVSKSM